MSLPSLGALSLDVHGTDPTGAGTCQRDPGIICNAQLGTKGWGVCVGHANATNDACRAIPVSDNPGERAQTVVPCIGGVYKLLRSPGRSNGIIFERNAWQDGHMCCVISDNTQYDFVNRVHTAIDTVLNIRTLLADNADDPRAIAFAKGLRKGMDHVFYADPKPSNEGAQDRDFSTYVRTAKGAFDGMANQMGKDAREWDVRRIRGVPRCRNTAIYEADTANRAWKNINLFVRLTVKELNRVFWYKPENPDVELRENNRAVFEHHYLYMGTWKVHGRATINGEEGTWLEPTVLQNSNAHEIDAMAELAKHVRISTSQDANRVSQGEALVVQALSQSFSPQYASSSNGGS